MTDPNTPDRPDLPDLPDLGGLLSGLQKMQDAQTQEYEGAAGGGVVRVRATGAMAFTAVEIAREAVDLDDVEMLQDLVLAALHDLSATIADAQRDAIGGIDLGELGDSLGGLFGGLGEFGGPGGEP